MKIVGVSAVVSNSDMASISKLWESFYSTDMQIVKDNALSGALYSVYSDYQGDHTAPYKLTIGFEVAVEFNAPEGLVETTISNNKHDVFHVEGQMPDVVIAKWQEIWGEKKPRTYVADFDRMNPDGSVDVHVEYV